jgi:hypothetical protein
MLGCRFIGAPHFKHVSDGSSRGIAGQRPRGGRLKLSPSIGDRSIKKGHEPRRCRGPSGTVPHLDGLQPLGPCQRLI